MAIMNPPLKGLIVSIIKVVDFNVQSLHNACGLHDKLLQ
jgi:hypothetical protein